MILRKLTGYFISLAVMPSQTLHHANNPELARFRLNKKLENVEIANRQIDATNGARIDFCEVSANDLKLKKDQKVIIHAVGNADAYEQHVLEYIDLAEKHPDYRVVGFNFRGTMQSRGRAWSEEDWVADVIAVVEYYKAQGIPTQNILLNGHSMGGALTALAAAKLYQQELAKAKNQNLPASTAQSVKLINNRSFSNLTDEIIISILGNKISAAIVGIFYGALLGFALGVSLLGSIAALSAVLVASLLYTEKLTQNLLRPWLKGLLWLTFGTIDAAFAYKSLPEEATDYLVAKNDIIIMKGAGMHDALKPRNTAKKAELRHVMAQSQNQTQIKEALETLLNLKDSKVESPPNQQGAHSHVAPLAQLKTYHKLRSAAGNLPPQIRASEVMENKIERLFKAKAR